MEPLPEPRLVTPTIVDIDIVDDPMGTGHMLMRAGHSELALRAFSRAYRIGDHGEPGEIEAALGTVNAQMGRLPSAERYLDISVQKAPGSVETWNNLGVVAMSLGKYDKARNAFTTAFALSSGRSDAARANLVRLDEIVAALPVAELPEPPDLELVRQGSGRYVLDTPSASGGTQ